MALPISGSKYALYSPLTQGAVLLIDTVTVTGMLENSTLGDPTVATEPIVGTYNDATGEISFTTRGSAANVAWKFDGYVWSSTDGNFQGIVMAGTVAQVVYLPVFHIPNPNIPSPLPLEFVTMFGWAAQGPLIQ